MQRARLLAERQVGHIVFRGPSVMTEYFRRQEETARVLSADGWLDTGDMGYLVGDSIVVAGRSKDLIIVNGRNVWPEDLELAVENHIDGVRRGDVVAFSVDGGDAERVVILVQSRTSDPVLREAQRAAVASVILSAAGLNCSVVLVSHNALPRTSSGKMSRTKARDMYLASLLGESEQAAASATPESKPIADVHAPAIIMSKLAAITGATGFLGRYIVRAIAARGWRVRVLARQPIDHPQFAGLQLDAVPGDLSNGEALRALVDGADVIIHAAGLIKARSSAAFEAVNVAGTANLAQAIEKSGTSPRVLLVSSMAAREPTLSSYARTKRAAEQL
jgi:hypothetical protein